MRHTIDMCVFFSALPLVYKPSSYILMLRLFKKKKGEREREREVKETIAWKRE